jgi:hypothetical protein
MMRVHYHAWLVCWDGILANFLSRLASNWNPGSSWDFRRVPTPLLLDHFLSWRFFKPYEKYTCPTFVHLKNSLIFWQCFLYLYSFSSIKFLCSILSWGEIDLLVIVFFSIIELKCFCWKQYIWDHTHTHTHNALVIKWKQSCLFSEEYLLNMLFGIKKELIATYEMKLKYLSNIAVEIHQRDTFKSLMI